MVGADAVEPAEGSTEARKRPSAEVPPGSESMARVQRRSPGTWEALSSPPEVERPHAERDEKGGRWYRTTSQRECCGKEAGSRSAPVVPEKRGNHPRGTPWREEARRVSEPQEGKMAETSSSTTVSTKQERIAMLARQMTCYASGCEMELRLAANH